MNTVQTFQAACLTEWGTVPQWLTFITSCLTFIGVIVGFSIAARQLRHNQSVRETENIIGILDSTVTHNGYYKEHAPAARAIQMLEGLDVPTSEPETATYWATREVHYSHLNLIWRVWELAGRPGRGKAINSRYDGWERFAREIVTKKLRASVSAVKAGGRSAEDLAASDIWSGLSTYEAFPNKFIQWLDGLDEHSAK